MRNTNYLKITIKKDRKCHSCGKKLKKGTCCLTVNSKATGRLWECDSCEEKRVKEFERKRIETIFALKYPQNEQIGLVWD